MDLIQQRTAITIDEAISKVMEDEVCQPIETVDLMQSVNRILAEDVVAIHPIPAFDRSLYDGYAIRAQDTDAVSKKAPINLEVIGEIGAGSVFTSTVHPGQAVRIMTGAEMPASCNAVIMLEGVTESTYGQNRIAISQKVSIGERVFAKGSELAEGTCIVAKGTQITPGVIGLLATFGFHQVKVTKKPVVGVLATGSELLEIDEPLTQGKIRNSNAYMLLAQIEQAGGEAVYFGKLEDDLETSVQVITEAIQQVDILITTGGVSVGDYDYMPAVYARLGADILFNKVAMRPGSVTTVAKCGNRYLFGLSGNPSASFIGFELFVRPLLQKRLGSSTPYLFASKAVLREAFPQSNNFTQIVRTTCAFEQGQLHVTSNGLNMSSSVTSIAGAEALAILRPTTTGYESGEVVDVLLLALQKGQSHSVFGGDSDAK